MLGYRVTNLALVITKARLSSSNMYFQRVVFKKPLLKLQERFSLLGYRLTKLVPESFRSKIIFYKVLCQPAKRFSLLGCRVTKLAFPQGKASLSC